MQNKRAYLVYWIMIVMTCGQAMAQSSHDAASGHDKDIRHDKDIKHAASDRFEILSADGKYRLGFRGYVQENNQFSHQTDNKKSDIDIKLKRARLSMYGHVIDPRLTFMVQTALEKDPPARVDGYRRAPGTDLLSDYNFNMAFHHNYFQLRIGKFSAPFSRQNLASASQLQFVDPFLASEAFQVTNTGKDVGVMLHNSYDNQFEWSLAGQSNGVAFRLGFNHHAIDGYDMVDWNGGNLRFAVAANGSLQTDYKTAKFADIRGGLDFIAKVVGLSTNGAFFYQWANEKDDAKHNFGTGLDVGYLIKGRIEPVVRHSWIKGATGAHVQQVLGGVNYYIHGHHLKLQGYGGIELGGAEVKRGLAGLQVQLAI